MTTGLTAARIRDLEVQLYEARMEAVALGDRLRQVGEVVASWRAEEKRDVLVERYMKRIEKMLGSFRKRVPKAPRELVMGVVSAESIQRSPGLQLGARHHLKGRRK